MFKRFRKSEKGQAMVEYALILALISIVSIGALTGLEDGIKRTFEKVVDDSDDSGFSGHIEVEEYEMNLYTITFKDAVGKELRKESVSPGGEVKVPNIPNVTEDMWDKPLKLDNIQSDGVYTLSYGIIETADDLNNVRNNLGVNYIQVANIDLSEFGNFEPIGKIDDTNSFKGTFDGGGYKIKNLTVNTGDSSYAGLFGWVEGATFKNIGLENVDVTGRGFTGSLVGLQSGSSVTNSYATGSVKGTGNRVGGLVGRQESRSSVKDSYFTGTVNGGMYTGGLVGFQSKSSIANSYSTAEVTGGSSAGGLVGYQQSSSVTDGYATGSVTGTGNNVGGLVGSQYELSKVVNSYATGNVTGSGDNTGGLVGYQWNDSSVNNSYTTGKVTGSGDNTGGLVGWQRSSSVVSNSYATGKVTGADSTGGLVGYQDNSSIANSYVTGEVKGERYTGGLVGFQWISSTTNSYATGSVTGTGNNVGGLIGFQWTSSTTNSYYDKETTEQSDTGKGTGKTPEEMKQQSTYDDWDFESIWEITEGQYPTLR